MRILQATDVRPWYVLSRPAAFWLLGATLVVLMFAGGAPSPLYVVYQARWGFSATVLTEVFAVYAVALLLALVTTGGLSDYVGRRPVLVAALTLEVVAMLLFVAADGVGWLLAARTVQGFATGAATGALSAGLIDLQPAGRARLGALLNSAGSTGGVALGALGSGLLVQFAPAPTSLVFILLAVAFAAAAVGVALMPETVRRRPGALASLRPLVRVPRGRRGVFFAATPILVAVWALAGLYLSLGPSLAADVLHVGSHLVGGLVIFVLGATASVSSILLYDRPSRPVMLAGSMVLAAGLAITLVGLGLASAAVFLVGTAVAGAGLGSAFLGAFRTMSALAEPDERAALLSTVYVVSYLAFSLPAIAAGMFASSFGLRPTATAYGIVLMVLTTAAVIGLALRRRGRSDSATVSPAG